MKVTTLKIHKILLPLVSGASTCISVETLYDFISPLNVL